MTELRNYERDVKTRRTTKKFEKRKVPWFRLFRFSRDVGAIDSSHYRFIYFPYLNTKKIVGLVIFLVSVLIHSLFVVSYFLIAYSIFTIPHPLWVIANFVILAIVYFVMVYVPNALLIYHAKGLFVEKGRFNDIQISKDLIYYVVWLNFRRLHQVSLTSSFLLTLCVIGYLILLNIGVISYVDSRMVTESITEMINFLLLFIMVTWLLFPYLSFISNARIIRCAFFTYSFARYIPLVIVEFMKPLIFLFLTSFIISLSFIPYIVLFFATLLELATMQMIFLVFGFLFILYLKSTEIFNPIFSTDALDYTLKWNEFWATNTDPIIRRAVNKMIPKKVLESWETPPPPDFKFF